MNRTFRMDVRVNDIVVLLVVVVGRDRLKRYIRSKNKKQKPVS